MELDITTGEKSSSIDSLKDVVEDVMDSEATVGAYQVDFFVKDGEGQQGLLRIIEGNCTGCTLAAQRSVVSGSESLVVRIKICNKIEISIIT